VAHIFKYRLKILLYDKVTMFWTLVFPIVLAGLFSLAFSRLGEGERLAVIDVALVENSENAAFVSAIEALSDGENRLFNLTRTPKDEALQLLAAGKVQGIITTDTPLLLTVNHSGIGPSILKLFVDSYMQSAAAVGRILAHDPTAGSRLTAVLAETRDFLADLPLNKRGTPNFMLIPYLSLLAMTCLLGGHVGMAEINALEANLSHHAARTSLAPLHKLKVLAAGMSAALLLQFSKLLLYFAFLVYLLGLDFGTRTPWVVGTILLCSMLSITFGAFVTSLVKGSVALKEGILLGVSLAGASLAGMNVAELKFIVERQARWLALINPAHRITDAFYALYYFDTYERFIASTLGIAVFILLFAGGTYYVVRRRDYVSL
jgi:ABC-2 type transport system permease protein